MGLRPPIVRARSAKTAGTSAPSSAAPRVVRPIPERTGPLRTADRLFRADGSDTESRAARPPHPAPNADSQPIADAVSKAYQVFDRYLEEGRRYAEGASPWRGEATTPSAALPSADLSSAAAWLLDQLRRIEPDGKTLADWPKPRWPATPLTAPSTPAAAAPDWPRSPAQPATEWEPWDFSRARKRDAVAGPPAERGALFRPYPKGGRGA
jgi:hypothetical protein